jgi:hypothetical protein
MGKLKLAVVFVAAAIVSGSLTLAPKAYAYWKFGHAVSCVPYSFGYGFRGVREGDLHVDAYGVSNSSDRTVDLICPDFHGSEFTGEFYAQVRAQFSRWYPASQVPRVQACGNYSCSGWYYGDPALNSWATVNIDFYAYQWRPGYLNTLNVSLDGTNQDWGKVLIFRGYTVGTDIGPL